MAMAQNDKMLPIGTKLHGGVYEIIKHLSNGGFGNTYVVKNVSFDEIYAMKEFFMKGINLREGDIVTVSVADNEATFTSQKEKLKKEARRLRQLKNPHIVRVHDLFEERGTVYYVMDYIEGESLAARLQRENKPLTEKETLDFLEQILDALNFVHSQKPQLLPQPQLMRRKRLYLLRHKHMTLRQKSLLLSRPQRLITWTQIPNMTLFSFQVMGSVIRVKLIGYQ